MTRQEAIEIVTQVACCSCEQLSCTECPLWEEKVESKGKCVPATPKEVAAAVRLLGMDAEAAT